MIGPYAETSYTKIDGVLTIIKEPNIAFVDEKEGKPLNIKRIIGKIPVIAVGDSYGEYAMLEWTTAGDGPRIGLILYHTHEECEVAYECDSHIDCLYDGLEKDFDLGWIIVGITQDWSRVFTGAR